MKKLLFLVISILFSQLTFAQSESEYEELYFADSIRFNEIENTFAKDCGNLPQIVTNAVVRYESSAEAYLEFDKSLTDDLRLKLTGEASESAQINISGNSIIITRIPLNQVFTLTFNDQCDNVISVANIETTVNGQNYINASSRKLFDAINLWAEQKEKSNESLQEYVFNLTEISRYEKRSFLQDYFFNDNVFPDDIEDERLVRSIQESTRSGGDCNCKVLQLATNPLSVKPGTVNGTTITQGGVINTGYNNNKRSRWTYNAAYKGPAKAVTGLYVQGAGALGGGDREKEIRTQDNPNAAGTPLIAEILYSLICVGAQQDPGDCDCKKRVDISYRYDSRINVETQKYLFGLVNTSSVEAEDWAAVIVDDGSGKKVIAAEGIKAVGDCNMTVNKQFVYNAIDMAAAIAATTVSGGALAPVLASEIKNVMKEELFTANSCSSQLFTKTLLDGEISLFLLPGKFVSAKLYSFDHVKMKGKNGFFSLAKINSDFALATSIPGGTGGKMQSCCMAPKGDWLSGSMQGPVSEPDLVKGIDLFLTKNGLSAKANVGTVIGNHEENCGKIDGIQLK
jgi:hypothetical protein